MIPGLNANLIPKGKEKEGTDRVKRFLYMMDSMTNEEIDCIKPLTETRIARIAQGSGTKVEEVNFLLEEHKKFQKLVGGLGKNIGDMKKHGGMDAMKRNPQAMMQQMSKSMDPKMLKQMGGMGNIMDMVKNMGGMEGMQEMMSQMMGGAGGAGAGAGGMPNLGALANMMSGMGGGGLGGMGVPPKMPPGMMKRRR